MTDDHLGRAVRQGIEIAWLEGVTDLDYVRQGAYLLWTRVRPPANYTSTGRVVGYANVGSQARSVRGYGLRGMF